MRPPLFSGFHILPQWGRVVQLSAAYSADAVGKEGAGYHLPTWCQGKLAAREVWGAAMAPAEVVPDTKLDIPDVIDLLKLQNIEAMSSSTKQLILI